MAAYNEYGGSRMNPSNTIRHNPPNTVRHEASNSSLLTQTSISASQVVTLAREAMKNALEENQSKSADANGVELKPGVTIDLSHKQIQKFPEEVVDIIKNELERLALSHNQISTFPSRFSECTLLRYLNVRNNVIREFPLSICQLASLEILDLGRNKLKILPPELAKLTSLKVLSVQKNRIEVLPLCLADMTSLQVLKLEGNPLWFPPREVLQPQASSPPNNGYQENEMDDIAVTSQIKKFLRQKAISDRSETESGGEESSEGTETPRPMKRVMSGRFPIKVNGADVSDLRSPAMQRPPPIPSRSHYRGLSQQSAALRRPGVLPLTIGNANERLRSNSESLLQASRDRSMDRSRRMGIITKKSTELTTVNETKSNRHSHFRGLSHGSAMSGSNGINGNTRSPASPADPGFQRQTFVRRLSSLPERKRESLRADPFVEAAKGMLYALWQVHPLIRDLLSLARNETNKRTSLERVYYNATTHVDVLDRELQMYTGYSEEEEETSPRSNENVRQACLACVGAYMHVCDLLSREVETLLENCDPRYIRTLLLLIYGSSAEIRNSGATCFNNPSVDRKSLPRVEESSESEDVSNGEVTKSQRGDKSMTPTRERPGTNYRNRSATVIHSGNLRVATDVPPPPFINGQGRSATFSSATPRSGESFASSSTTTSRMGDFSEHDRLFEAIFLQLQQAIDMAIKALPIVKNHFVATMRTSSQDHAPQFWQVLIQATVTALYATENLKSRMSMIKLNEPGIRSQGAFWELCNSFISTYTDLVVKVKEAKASTYHLPQEVIQLLRPLQIALKECSQTIKASPWAFLATSQASQSMSNSSAYGTRSPNHLASHPMPMTPQSAALGPAVQATVPSTQQSVNGSYNAMFSGNFFERADTFLSTNGGSLASSRAGTMTSNTGMVDGNITPASIISPLNIGGRFNDIGNGKYAF